MTIAETLEHFNANRQKYLEQMLTLLRFQTISAQKAHVDDMRQCVNWLRDTLIATGLEAEVVETAGHPAVIADTGPVGDNCPTVLVYGHYDVQPEGNQALWDSPAFEPTLRDGKIFARGSADDKGQFMTHITALRCCKAVNTKPPVRVKLLLEGEEEIGSPHLADVIRQYRDRLACDYVLISDTGKLDQTTPALAYATRGLVYKEITVEGPKRDLHSGQYGGAVANPINALTQIIASLHDENQRVTIPGFYDDVCKLTDDERSRLAEHAMSDDTLMAATGCLPVGEKGFTTTERIGGRPTLDVNGIVGGYIADGAATVIPERASAKISMRLVADQNPEHISDAFDRAVQTACPEGVKLTIANHSHCGAYRGKLESPAMSAAVTAFEKVYGKTPAYTREGGSLPILPMFQQILDADSVLLGFADPDCNLHSPNEFFAVSDFDNGVRCVLTFLDELAG